MVMICRDDEESDKIIFSGVDSAGSLNKDITWWWWAGEEEDAIIVAAPAVKDHRGTLWQMSI